MQTNTRLVLLRMTPRADIHYLVRQAKTDSCLLIWWRHLKQLKDKKFNQGLTGLMGFMMQTAETSDEQHIVLLQHTHFLFSLFFPSLFV